MKIQECVNVGFFTLANIMPTFDVVFNSMIVGTSELERGDAPMGVAVGRFFPTENYAVIQEKCIGNHEDQSELELVVMTSKGQIIECVGVAVLDFSPDLGPEAIELNVLGIPYPLYGEIFPHHVASYDRQFK